MLSVAGVRMHLDPIAIVFICRVSTSYEVQLLEEERRSCGADRGLISDSDRLSLSVTYKRSLLLKSVELHCQVSSDAGSQ